MTSDRILVRPGGVGDSLLLAPSLALLREHHPDSRIVLVGYPERLAPLQQAGLADCLVPLDIWMNHPERFLEEMMAIPNYWSRSCGESAVCSSFPRIDSFFPQKPIWLEGKVPGDKFHFHPLLPRESTPQHIVVHLARCLGFFQPLERSSPLRNLPGNTKKGRESPHLWIHPGAGGKAKRWPLDCFLQLADDSIRHGFQVTFLAGEAEEDILPQLNESGFDLISPPSLSDLIEQFSQEDRFLGNDSGISHLAALCGLRTYAVFGPSDPLLWSPWGKDVTVIRSESARWPGVLEVRNEIFLNNP